VTPTLAELVAFLREKLSEAERAVAAREEMARAEETVLSPKEWRRAMALHPSTRGTPQPTAEERAKRAAVQRKIADKYRREADLYRAVLARLEPPAADATRERINEEIA